MHTERARIGLTCLLASLSIGISACDNGGGAGNGGVGGETGGIDASTGAGGGLGATGGGGTVVGLGGATGSVDAGRDTGGLGRDAGGGVDTGADSGGGDTARPGTGGRAGGTGGAVGTGGRAGTGGGPGVGGAGGAGTLPPVTIWIAGDSTVATGSAPCPIGWGGQFKPFFSDRVTVTNSAVAGRSVRTWLYFPTLDMDASGECVLPLGPDGMPMVQPHWQAMLDGMKAGDYLFIQFGINDSSPTCDRHVGLGAFEDSYGVMAMAAKAVGANPVFVTPVSAIACKGAVPQPTRGGYVTTTEAAGTKFNVPVIDLHALSIALYTTLNFCPLPGGVDVSATTTGPVGDFFCDDHTHFSPTGAVQISTLVANAVRAQIPGLAAYLK